MAQTAPISGGAGAKGDGVAKGEPQYTHQAGNAETLHKHAQNIPRAHKPPIEQSQPRQCHKEHQSRGNDNPSCIGSVHSHLLNHLPPSEPNSARDLKRLTTFADVFLVILKSCINIGQ
jgi:hypothetical protein